MNKALEEYLALHGEETKEKNTFNLDEVDPLNGLDLNKFNVPKEELEQIEKKYKPESDQVDELEETPTPPTAPVIPFDPKQEARNYTLMIDATQRLIFTGINTYKGNKRAGGAKEFQSALDQLEEIGNDEAKLSKLSREDRKNIKVVVRTKKKLEALPMTASEKEVYTDALEQLVKENGYKMPPNVMLFIATINMLLPRIIDATTE